jgi:hypothetical protein
VPPNSNSWELGLNPLVLLRLDFLGFLKEPQDRFCLAVELCPALQLLS